MKEYILHISYFFLFITIIVLFYYYKKYKLTNLKALPFLFLLSGIVTTYSNYLAQHKQYNIWLIVNYVNIEQLFILILFFLYIKNKNHKKIVLALIVLYEAFFIIDYFILNYSEEYYPMYSLMLGQFSSIIVIFIFLLEMISSDKIMQLQNYFIFWVAIAFLFYLIVPLPVNIATAFFVKKSYSNNVLNLSSIIQNLSNIVMYIILILSAKWSTMTYK